MEITAIKKGKNHLFSVELLGADAITLDKKTVIDEGLFVGQDLSAKQISALKSASDYTRTLSRAVWYLERGDLSEKALRQKLSRAKFPEKAIEKAILRLNELALLNDEGLAERLAEKLLENNISERAAVQKMVAKGLDYSLAKRAVEDLNTDPMPQIRAIIEKKYKKKLESPENAPKVFAALQRLGFSYSDIRAALKAYSEEIEFSEENYGL